MELQSKVLKDVPFLEKVHFALISMQITALLYREKAFKHFNLSPFCIIEDDFITMLDQMSPTIKLVTLKGDNLDLWINQTIGDIITPFRFMTTLRLSRCPAVDTLQFLWQVPLTLKELELDFLSVPTHDFVQYVPVLSNQLTKYDLVNILQGFWKLDELNIVDSEFLTPSICETIYRYCYNLQKFYFSMNFRMSDMRAWIGLLGMDMEHVEFTEVENGQLETYLEIEAYYERQDDGYKFLDSD